jgi:hypothetical protein
MQQACPSAIRPLFREKEVSSMSVAATSRPGNSRSFFTAEARAAFRSLR